MERESLFPDRQQTSGGKVPTLKRSIGMFSSTAVSRLRWRTFCVFAICLVGLSSPSTAGTITVVPPGLAPGSQYRLVFLTGGFYSATSSDIADYNTEVNHEANGIAALAALGTTWKVIGSTATVNAIDNIGQDPGVPIYDLSGNKVAADDSSGTGGLFSGSLLGPIDVTAWGPPRVDAVWTGTLPSGLFGAALGGASLVTKGSSGASDISWIQSGEASPDHIFRLYSISGVLKVPDSSDAPEPRTTLMVAVGGTLLLGARRRMIHRKNRATQTFC